MRYEKLETTLIENTITKSCYDGDELVAYRIIPDDGYVIHTKFYDTPVINEETLEETGEMTKGYTDSHIAVRSNYDFEENPFDIYTVRKEEAE